jgi:hypothetical protein
MSKAEGMSSPALRMKRVSHRKLLLIAMLATACGDGRTFREPDSGHTVPPMMDAGGDSATSPQEDAGMIVTPMDGGIPIDQDAGTVGDPEICNGLDDDHDGRTDEDLAAPSCALVQGVCSAARQTCGGSLGWIACEVSDYGASYESVETTCDGLDNDCDGRADETLSAPSCALTEGVCAGRVRSCGGASGWLACTDYGSDYQATESRCDGLDNDCDGETDEGCGCSLPGDTCGTSSICACPGLASSCSGTGTCVPLFGTYQIQIASAMLPALDPSGADWDVGLVAPDPYVQVNVAGGSVGTTPVVADAFRATWPPAVFNATLSNGTVVRLDVYDEDVLSDDFAFMCSITINAAALRARTFTCTAGSSQVVTGAFVPVP